MHLLTFVTLDLIDIVQNRYQILSAIRNYRLLENDEILLFSIQHVRGTV
jgi:hypothetical protein